MKNSLFVAGFEYATSEDNLKDLFAKHGTVTQVKIITDRMSGQSKGFAFIDMANQSDAENCIKNLNNTYQGSRQMTVRIKDNRGNSGYPSRNSSKRGY